MTHHLGPFGLRREREIEGNEKEREIEGNEKESRFGIMACGFVAMSGLGRSGRHSGKGG